MRPRRKARLGDLLGGLIRIGKAVDPETATCSNSSGPALALCIKR
jgi:hypothetical protein